MPEPHPGADLDQAGLGRRVAASVRCPAARRPATPAPGPRPVRPPPAAADAGGCRQGLSRRRKSPRSAPTAASRRGGRTRPPARPAKPSGQLQQGSGLPSVSARSRSRTWASSGPVSAASSSARASASRRPSTTAPATRPARRLGRGPRRPGRPTRRPAGGHEPRTCAEADAARVIDQADQWVLLGDVGQQADGGQADQVGPAPARHSGRTRSQRDRLRSREPFRSSSIGFSGHPSAPAPSPTRYRGTRHSTTRRVLGQS